MAEPCGRGHGGQGRRGPRLPGEDKGPTRDGGALGVGGWGVTRQHRGPDGNPTLSPDTPQRHVHGEPDGMSLAGWKGRTPGPGARVPTGRSRADLGVAGDIPGVTGAPACMYHQVVAPRRTRTSSPPSTHLVPSSCRASSRAQGTGWHSDTIPGRDRHPGIPAAPQRGRSPRPTSHKRAGGQAPCPQ